MFDFGRIKGGEVVKYTYVFTNMGGAMLEVSNVHATCGCTTAGDWTRQVEPGKTGSIPIQFNSGNFNGQVAKPITVTCNDTSQPTVVLQIKATIWKPVEVTPQFVFLTVNAESPSQSTTVRIVSHEESPLTLSAPESSHPAFAAELKTNQPGKQFELVVRMVPPLPAGNVQGQITVKTSSTNLPVVNITARANVQPVVVIEPPEILVLAAQVNPRPYTVSIRNNGTNVLVLSEPTVNAKGVNVKLKEVEPRRGFTLALNFPMGFALPQGEKVELSVKSNHPQYPMIRVPVIQKPSPAGFEVPGVPRPGNP